MDFKTKNLFSSGWYGFRPNISSNLSTHDLPTVQNLFMETGGTYLKLYSPTPTRTVATTAANTTTMHYYYYCCCSCCCCYCSLPVSGSTVHSLPKVVTLESVCRCVGMGGVLNVSGSTFPQFLLHAEVCVGYSLKSLSVLLSERVV